MMGSNHGYQYRIMNYGGSSSSTTSGTTTDTDTASTMTKTIKKKLLPIEHIQKETSEHQLEDRKMMLKTVILPSTCCMSVCIGSLQMPLEFVLVV